MAKKVSTDFEWRDVESSDCADLHGASPSPPAGTVPEEWLRSNPRLTTDTLVNPRDQQAGGHYD